MNKLKKMLINRIKNNKGSMLIEYVVGMLVFLIFVGFCLDTVFIGHKHFYMGQEMSTIARTISVQSGAESSTPSNFPGGSTAYQTSSEIITRLEKVAKTAGFKSGEYKLEITETTPKGTIVKQGELKAGTNFQASYLNKITITFTGQYEWGMLSTIIQGHDFTKQLIVERVAMAEYMRDYD